MITKNADGFTLTYINEDGVSATTNPGQGTRFFFVNHNLSLQLSAQSINLNAHADYLGKLRDYQADLNNGKPHPIPIKPKFAVTLNDYAWQDDLSYVEWPGGLPDPKPFTPSTPAPSSGVPVSGGPDRKPDPSDQLSMLLQIEMANRQDILAIKAKLGL